jgi:hypothetical protein
VQILIVTVLTTSPGFALSQAQHDVFSTGVRFFNVDLDTPPVCGGGGSQVAIITATPIEIQIANAKIIIGIAKTENLGKNGALIGIMVGLDESGLRVLANQKVPLSESNPNKQGDGHDGYSLGVFQQQIIYNWSTISSDPNNAATVNQLMNPAYNAEAFFGSPPGSKAPSVLSKGLQNHPEWQSLEPWIAAQKVQASGDPTGANYHAQLAAAQNLINTYYDLAPAIPLPVAFNAAPSAGGGGNIADSCATGSTSFTGDEHDLARQILANTSITYDYGPNGIVIKPFQDLAANKKAGTYPNSDITDVSVTLLKYILTIAQTHKLNISSLTTQHDPGDIHSSGYAVDFNILDGTHIIGRDPGTLSIIAIGIKVLPKGTGFGEQYCPGTPVVLPEGFIQFFDTCNHLHTQLPRGTP